MSEVTFAKSFLATLDKRAIKLPPDHVSDPKNHPNQSPFILPRQPHPFPRKPSSSAASQGEKTLTATLKPMRATGETLSLPDTTLDTTIHDLKTQYAQKTGLPLDKIKLLLHKKPAADLKTLKDLGVDGGVVELSVMVMGGGVVGTSAAGGAVESPVPPPAEKMEVDEKGSAPESEKASVEAERASGVVGDSAAQLLKTDEFWEDLRGFLSQRLRDEKAGDKYSKVFREAWRKG